MINNMIGAKIIHGLSPSLYKAILNEQKIITEPKSGCKKD